MAAGKRDLIADLGGNFRLNLRWRDGQGNPLNLTAGAGKFELLSRTSAATVLYTKAAVTTADGWIKVNVPAADVATWPEHAAYRVTYTGDGTDVLLVGRLRTRGPDDA